jgi:uncharacterized membrane protein
LNPEALLGLLFAFGCIAFALFVAVRALTAARPERVEQLESRLRELARQVAEIDEGRAPADRAGATSPVDPPAAPPPPPIPPVADLPPAPTLPRVPRERVRPRTGASLETFLGGRVLLVVGVVVVLFGLAFFLKFAIDHGWITAGARIVMGLVAGVALLIGGEILRRRSFDVFGQALMGCGLGALYLSNFFACTRYSFISTGMAFTGTAVVTVLGSALALLRRAPVLAYLGFLGGYLAPALLATRSSELVHLTFWLLWVDAGVVVVLLCRSWQGLDLLALLFTAWYFGGWFRTHSGEGELGTVCACLAALVAMSLGTGVAPLVVRRVAPAWFSLMGVAVAGTLGVIAAHHLLFPEHRTELALGVAGLAAAYFAAFRLVAARVPEGRLAAEGLLGFAAGAATTAVVVATRGLVVAPVLSIMGVAIVFAGARTRHPILLASGISTILVAGGDLLTHRLALFQQTLTPFLNERFFVFASPCVALMVAGWIIAREKEANSEAGTVVASLGMLLLPVLLAADFMCGIVPSDPFHHELRLDAPAFVLAVYGLLAARLFGRAFARGRGVAFVPLLFALCFGMSLFVGGHLEEFALVFNPTFAAGVAIAVAAGLATIGADALPRDSIRVLALLYLLGLVTAEIHAWGVTGPIAEGTRDEAQFRATVWISVAWAVDAAVLVAIGFWRGRPGLRWMGLGVFALTLVKVVLVEMAQLEAVYRIGSFLVLGALLLAASFLYQRTRSASRGG